MELDAVDAALDVLERGDRRLGRARQRGEARAAPRRPCRGATSSTSARPGVPASRRPGLGDRQPRAAELADLGALDPAAERQDDRLHAVTDAQHGDPELEQRRDPAAARPPRTPRPGRRRGSAPSGCAGGPPRRRRGAAAARRRRRTRARAARSAASTGRRSRGRRPRRCATRALERELLDAAGRPASDGARGPRETTSVGLRLTRHCRRPARGRGCALPRAPMPISWSRWSCLPSVCSAGATISSARLNSAMSW